MTAHSEALMPATLTARDFDRLFTAPDDDVVRILEQARDIMSLDVPVPPGISTEEAIAALREIEQQRQARRR